jgi:hypothetical protein
MTKQKIGLGKIVDSFYLRNLAAKDNHTFATMYFIC